MAARMAEFTALRTRRLRCIRSRRRSRYRWRRRTVSSTSSARESIGKGGGSAVDRTSTSQSPTSTSPVGRLGLTVPSGRRRTVPVMRSTYSLRTSTAWLTTHWTRPVWSRRSRKARCSPCSRRRATQPQRLTVRPASLARSVPHWSVRMLVGRPVLMTATTCRTASTRPVRGTASCRRSPRPSSVRRARSVTDACGQLVRSDDHGHLRARPVGRLHLALHAPLVERPVRGDAGRPQLGGQGQRLLPAGGVDDVDLRLAPWEPRTRPRHRRPAGSARSPRRTPRHRCRAARRAPPRGRCSGRRRRWRSGPSRGRATGTRTACGCSSRARARGAARSRRRSRAPSAPPAPDRSAPPRPASGTRAPGARRPPPAGPPAVGSRGPAAG